MEADVLVSDIHESNGQDAVSAIHKAGNAAWFVEADEWNHMMLVDLISVF